MRTTVIVLVLLIVVLQYKAWLSDAGYVRAQALVVQVDEQERRTEVLEKRNQVLEAEVRGLKRDRSAVEARARSDLGMVREGEEFYLVPKDAW